MSIKIREGDLQAADVVRLLQQHLASAAMHSPPESVHALNLDALKATDITFWTLRNGTELLGCGALKEIDSHSGEIKSMRTAEQHLRKGIATLMLQHIIDESTRRRYSRLSLETGSMDAFAAARALYERFGFTYCAPFADYREDPYSVCMTLAL